MTPQQIVDLKSSLHARCMEQVRAQREQERVAIKVERERIQALCVQHTGHLFGAGEGTFEWACGGTLVCVYCGHVKWDKPTPSADTGSGGADA